MMQQKSGNKYEEILVTAGEAVAKKVLQPTLEISKMEKFGKISEQAEYEMLDKEHLLLTDSSKKLSYFYDSGYIARNYVNEEMEDFRFEILKEGPEEYRVVT
jgi:hypothetical protein